jgi:copper(I)-binding protein
MRLKTLILLMLALLTVSCTALIGPHMEIQGGWVKEAKISEISQADLNKSCICDVKPGTLTTNAFMTIKNNGFQEDRLIGAESDEISRIEFRQTSPTGDFLSALESIVIPAHGEITFAPGGYVMLFMGIKEDLKPGEKLKLRLIFEKTGTSEAVLDIQAADYRP